MTLSSFVSYALENPELFFLLPVGVVLAAFIYYRYDDYLIKKIAYRGVRVPERLPFGLDLIWRAIKTSSEYRDLEWWDWIFEHIPVNPQPSFEGGLGSKEKGNWFRDVAPTVEQNFAGRRFLFTADPENIKAILATQFNDYGKGELFHKDWTEFLGDGIFVTDGQQWSDSRALVRPQFIKSRVGDLEVLERHVQKLMGLMGGQGEELDASELFYRFTLDSATEFLFGESVNSLDNAEAEFAMAFAEVQRVQNIITRAGPLSYWVPKRSYRRGLRIVNKFVDHFVSQVLSMPPSQLAAESEKLSSSSSSSQGHQTFLRALANFTRDKSVIRDQLVNILLAGRDTTAGTLSFLFYELSCHPAIVEKLRREILERIGPSRYPSYDDIKNFRYLNHVINETLRLYPAVPINVRLATKDTTLPRGGGPDGTLPLGVRKDTPVVYATLHLQRSPAHYPPISPQFPNILDFCPERWEHWTPKPWTYIPFNGGPRICIGQQFALTQMGYTVVRILQRFAAVSRYEAGRGGQPRLKCEIVISPADGVRVGFWDAKKNGKSGGV